MMSSAHTPRSSVPIPSILHAVGSTPMVRLARLSPKGGATVWGKCEHLNPGGSAKDRIALALLAGIPAGATVVEASSGNTAIALAQAAAVTRHPLVLVMSEKVSDEKRRIVRAFGAEVVLTPKVPPEHPEHYRNVASRIARERPGAVFLDQFANPAATDAHYQTTGPEILAALGKVDAFVAGAGTGGTLTGVARFLKEHRRQVRILCADPPGSLLSGAPHPYLVEGIGVDFDLPGLDLSLVDEVVTVTDEESFAWARRLAREEGLLVGGSAGAAVAAAVQEARKLPRDANVVALLADTGRNYLSTFHDDAWLRAHAPGAIA